MRPFILITILAVPLLSQSVPFTNATALIPFPSWYGGNHGVNIVDYDMDGWDDLLITNRAIYTTTDTSFCSLFHNNKDGTFSNVTAAAGIRVHLFSKAALFFDVNNDGFPDLFIGSMNGIGRCHLFMNNGNGTFRDVAPGFGIDLNANVATLTAGDYDNDGRADLFVATEYPDYDLLYRNTSHGDTISFTDVTATAGVAGYTSTAAMQATFIDLDQDGDLDLYCVHDGYLASNLFRNNGDGTFTDRSIATGLYDYGAGNSMGVYWNDYDHDGKEEVYVSRIGKGGLYKYRAEDGKYVNIADSTGAELNGMTWGIVWEDLDNDGDDDLMMVNTYGYNGMRSFYYENVNGNYVDMALAYNVNFPYSLYGLACGDFNNDGFLDVATASSDGHDQLLKNTGSKGGNWLRLSLTGTTVNRMAIGVTVVVWAGGTAYRKTVTAGNGYTSQMSPILHVGLGKISVIDSIEVQWKPGNYQHFYSIGVNHRYGLTEGGALTVVTSIRREQIVPDRTELLPNYPNPFNPATTIPFRLSESADVTMSVYDMMGRMVSEEHIGRLDAGGHAYRWNGGACASGIYLCRLQAGNRSSVRRMVLLK